MINTVLVITNMYCDPGKTQYFDTYRNALTMFKYCEGLQCDVILFHPDIIGDDWVNTLNKLLRSNNIGLVVLMPPDRVAKPGGPVETYYAAAVPVLKGFPVCIVWTDMQSESDIECARRFEPLNCYQITMDRYSSRNSIMPFLAHKYGTWFPPIDHELYEFQVHKSLDILSPGTNYEYREAATKHLKNNGFNVTEIGRNTEVGWVTDEQYIEMIQQSTFVLCLKRGPQTVADMFRAMLCGSIPILYDSPTWKFMFIPDRHGIVYTEDADELRHKLNAIRSDEGLHMDILAENRIMALHMTDPYIFWSHAFSQTIRVYSNYQQ
jgi:hypothetical protein